MPYSRVTYTAAGGPEVFAVNFTLGYLSKDHVTARVNSEVDGGGSPVYRTITWLTEGTVTLGGAALVTGDSVVLERNTPKTILYHDYADGEVMTEQNFDDSFKQAIMIAHEALDGRLGTFEQDLNMGQHKITNLANGTAAADAVNFQQLTDATGNAPAFAAAAAASASSAAANAVLTAADVVTTNQAKLDAQAAFASTQALAGNINWTRVRVATTANITLSGIQTIDGVLLVAGDRVLVKNQSTGSQNGIYVVAAGAWVRAGDADTWDELVSKVIQVSQGTVSAELTYVITNDTGGTLGSTSVVVTAYTAFIANGSISTIKLADNNVTYIKLVTSAIATAAELYAGTASKLVNAAILASTPLRLQRVLSTLLTVVTGSTQIPDDDSIPQNTEGFEVITATITPKLATSKLVISGTLHVSPGAGERCILALFKDAGANAIAAYHTGSITSGVVVSIPFRHEVVSGSTAAATYRLRVGPVTGATTLTVNGSGGARKMGGIFVTELTIEELLP